MLKSYFLLLPLFIFVFFLSCETGPSLNGASDAEVSINVENGATDITPDKTFSVVFSAPVSVGSVNSNTFFIVPTSTSSLLISKAIQPKFSVDATICNPENALSGLITPSSTGSCETEFTLTPTSSLSSDTNYAVCITTGIDFCDSDVNGYFTGLTKNFTTSSNPVSTYSVGATISGLSGTIVLQNNETDDLTITENGSFTFSTEINDDATYEVTVKTQPDSQICTVSHGAGTISDADITNITISCVTNTYSIGGTISGLSGTVVLQNNSSDDLTITENGDFTFSTAVSDGGSYEVTILTHPSGQVCTVSNSADIVSGTNVTSVTVFCILDQWAKSTITDPNDSFFYGVSVGSSGYIYTTGYIRGADNYNFGGISDSVAGGYAAGKNPITVKYDQNGEPQWAVSASPNPNTCYFEGIAVDSNDNVYIAGYVRADAVQNCDFGNGVTSAGLAIGSRNALIVKYSSEGDAQWARSAVTAPEKSRFYKVSVDSNDNIYAVGYIYNDGVFDFGGSSAPVNGDAALDSYNAVIVKYDTNGNAKWAKTTVTASDSSIFRGIAIDNSNNIYTVGYISSDSDFDFGGSSDSVSGAYAGAFPDNAVIVKYDIDSDAKWAKSTTAADDSSQFTEAATDSNGNIYAVGYFYEDNDYYFGGAKAPGTPTIPVSGYCATDQNAFIVKYNSSGEAQAAMATKEAPVAPSTKSSTFNDVSVDSNNNIYAVGSIEEDGQFNFGTIISPVTAKGSYDSGDNAIIVKYDSTLTTQWASSTEEGAASRNRFFGVAVNSSDNIFAAGYIIGSEEFDFGIAANPLVVTGASATEYNALIVKYDKAVTE
jgi:hypothetical protein